MQRVYKTFYRPNLKYILMADKIELETEAKIISLLVVTKKMVTIINAQI